MFCVLSVIAPVLNIDTKYFDTVSSTVLCTVSVSEACEEGCVENASCSSTEDGGLICECKEGYTGINLLPQCCNCNISDWVK